MLPVQPNVFEGAKVPVVLDGGRVAGGHDGTKTPGGIKIKKGKLRGIESNGMMCSIEELGSSREMFPDAPVNGLYIFDEDAPVGENAVSYLGLDDSVIEYEITSNRVDCFSVLELPERQQQHLIRSLFLRLLQKPEMMKMLMTICKGNCKGCGPLPVVIQHELLRT